MSTITLTIEIPAEDATMLGTSRPTAPTLDLHEGVVS